MPLRLMANRLNARNGALAERGSRPRVRHAGLFCTSAPAAVCVVHAFVVFSLVIWRGGGRAQHHADRVAPPDVLRMARHLEFVHLTQVA